MPVKVLGVYTSKKIHFLPISDNITEGKISYGGGKFFTASAVGAFVMYGVFPCRQTYPLGGIGHGSIKQLIK